MYFNSLSFLAFILIIFLLYWLLPSRFSKYTLLGANLVFIAFFGVRVFLWALVISLLGYSFGIAISKKQGVIRKRYLIFSISIIAVFLLLIKYFPLCSNIFSNLLIPIGMSFYSFRNISYLIDVYRGNICQKNLVIFLDYSLFFPSFSSGPIDRANDLFPQLSIREKLDYNLVSKGLVLFLWGLFKKIIVSAHMNFYTDWVFGDISSHTGFTLIFVSVLYTIQIYCDFSGYSDMAIGVANILGISLKRNFLNPYGSTSISEFWRKWHISLSSWLRDYVYIPLGGSRCSKIRNCANILVTFFVSGMWHGASLNYILWGLGHGICQVIEKLLKVRPSKKNGIRLVQIVFTFIIVNFLWTIFRLTDFNDISYFFVHIFDGITNPLEYVMNTQRTLHVDFMTLLRLILISVGVLAYDHYDEKIDIIDRIINMSRVKRIFLCTVFGIVLFFLLPVEPATDYIYFQF